MRTPGASVPASRPKSRAVSAATSTAPRSVAEDRRAVITDPCHLLADRCAASEEGDRYPLGVLESGCEVDHHLAFSANLPSLLEFERTPASFRRRSRLHHCCERDALDAVGTAGIERAFGNEVVVVGAHLSDPKTGGLERVR